MSLKSNSIKLSIVLILFNLCLIPFNFDLKEELMIALSVLIFFLLLYYLLLPKQQSDIKSKLVQLEISNAQLSDQLKQVILSMPIPLVVVDNNLNIQIQNLGFQQIYDNHDKSLKGLNHSAKSVINQAILSSGSIRQSIILNDREYLLVSNHLQYKGSLATLLLFNDITSFMEVQKNQKRFIADASHELKTPITAIKGMSEILRTHEVDYNTQSEFIEGIYKESLRLQHIVNDLLDLSKLSSNRIVLNPTVFNFSDLIKDVYHSLKTIFIQKNISFIYDFKQIDVFLDYERLQQIMINLISNSLNYSDKGKITLHTFKSENKLHIVLKDEGYGIEAKHIPHLFNRFYRVDEARNRQIGGSGLGLSIVKEIVDAHNGEINIQSIVNVGTQIEIILPLKKLTQS